MPTTLSRLARRLAISLSAFAMAWAAMVATPQPANAMQTLACESVVQFKVVPPDPTTSTTGYVDIEWGDIQTIDPVCETVSSGTLNVFVNGVDRAGLLNFEWAQEAGQLNRAYGELPLTSGIYNVIIAHMCRTDCETDIRADTTGTTVYGNPRGAPRLASAGQTILGHEQASCLQVGIATRASLSCGHVEMSQPLPAVRTYTQMRVPMLYYNSGLAWPGPLLQANITIGSDVQPPDSVEMTARVRRAFTTDAFVERATKRWNGMVWAPGESRRAALMVNAVNDSTGVYDYQLIAANLYQNSDGTWDRREAPLDSGRYVVVNRVRSRYGAGWWVAGVELLKQIDGDRILWIGGDGSYRLFVRRTVGSSVWDAPYMDGPDSLLSNTSGVSDSAYTRRLPNGTHVVFDQWGRHRKTINPRGHVTSFMYAGTPGTTEALYLRGIQVPGWNDTTYRFTYRSEPEGGGLAGVGAPSQVGPGTSYARHLVLKDSMTWAGISGARGITRIEDVNGLSTRFAWLTTGPVPSVRHDRTGAQVELWYHDVREVSRFSVELAADTYARTYYTDYRTAAGGLQMSPPLLDSAYVLIDGPRWEVNDHMQYWLNREGVITRIRDAQGHVTSVAYDSISFPLVPTRIEHPTGQVERSTLNARGFVIESIDMATAGTPTYATGCPTPTVSGVAVTTYQWDERWAQHTTVCSPGGERTERSYDEYGNLHWAQDGRGQSTRTTFHYDADSKLLRSAHYPMSRPDSLVYDSLKNVSEHLGPAWQYNDTLHAAREPRYFSNNNIGFTFETRTHVRDPEWNWTYVTIDSTEFDVVGRVTRSISVAPQDHFYDETKFGAQGWTELVMQIGAPRVEHVRRYDGEGRLLMDSVDAARSFNGGPWVRTNNAQITTYRYNRAGWLVSTVAPDGNRDTTIYDYGGNATHYRSRRGMLTGATITMDYDAMNRLTSRSVPQYHEPAFSYAGVPQMPHFRQKDGSYLFPNGITLAAATHQFTYDPMGRILTANNDAARVTWS